MVRGFKEREMTIMDGKWNLIKKQYIRENSKCQSLWASTRMVYDYIAAKEVGTDIITMSISHIKKLKMIGINPKEYSLETVKQFHEDAKSSGFKI